MSNDTNSKTEENAAKPEKKVMEQVRVFFDKPITRKDVAIVIVTAASIAGGYYGYQKYQSNKKLSTDSGLDIKNIA